ncbi:hypothetical protein DYU05_07435 [Mucilaginibacter terrenus]|uniref:Uncharacterized protein YyaB-like PH domain-containing protein n=1 Tax=Mucilaginibacter terrenus TaxID=2482727 RepID=A0A3E2NWW8_9SPHI|nr:PH domain-containing protein [Mucilaginibacter terrenus]RFZ85421.1 hypothetical protein DYU05_07435 [Mucilaginibacter terrenus]
MLNQRRVFPSKRGFVIYIPLIIMVAIGGIYLYTGEYIALAVMLTVICAIFLPAFFDTWYAVSDTSLQVKSGLFHNKIIEIAAIKKIEDTRTIFSAPALSLDRLEIFYNKFDSIVISPENKAEFIRLLKDYNPLIEYVNKHA